MCLLYLLLVLSLTYVNSARILCIFQMPAVSHQRVFQPIWKELALRGHEVTVVTPKPLNNLSLVNLREIDVSNTNNEIMQRHGFQFFMNKEHGVYTKIHKISRMFHEFADAIFQNEEFMNIYNNSYEKFDVVIAQTFVSPILYSLAARFQAPLIGVSSMGAYVGSHYAMGNPNPPSMYSEMFLPYHGQLSFYQRLKSTLYYLFVRIYHSFVILPQADKLARKYLGNDLPNIEDIERNMSLLLLTINPFLYAPRPMIPTIISLENLHVKQVEPLPQDLKTFFDEAKEGVIYFSLGSTFHSINIPDRVKDTLIAAFAELPYKILWKFESDSLPNQPKNVIIRKWLPQKDVLAHPNVKLFFSQCGLQSTEETISRGVPIVALPVIDEQEMNAKRLVELGVAVQLDFVSFTKEEVKEAIIEVAENPKYRKNMNRLRKLWTDQPMNALDRAIWWIEYVIRNKGTEHLRTPYSTVSWIEYLLLDVILVIVLAFIVTTYLLTEITKFIYNFCDKQKCKAKKC